MAEAQSPVISTESQSSTGRRSCWVCFATDEDDLTATWVRPCRCKGTTKWVHHNCLQRWIDEKQRGNSAAKVSCPQCNTEYLIIFPKLGSILYALDLYDKALYKVCPFVAGGIVVGSIYWTAVTYGAVTVMQVLGHKEGLTSMEQADPLFLLIGLPTIPVMLVLGKMCRWEDYLLKLWRKHSSKIPLLQYLFPDSYENVAVREPGSSPAPFSDPMSATRVLCGAIILPTVATICGKMMFSGVCSNLQRTVLGGIAFVAIKGALKLYYKQQQYIRQAKRHIVDYDDALLTLAAKDAAAADNSQQQPNTAPSSSASSSSSSSPYSGAVDDTESLQ